MNYVKNEIYDRAILTMIHLHLVAVFCALKCVFVKHKINEHVAALFCIDVVLLLFFLFLCDRMNVLLWSIKQTKIKQIESAVGFKLYHTFSEKTIAASHFLFEMYVEY